MAASNAVNEDLGLNNEGYLMDQSKWSESFAQKLAKREGIERLDDEHLAIITTLRKHYERHQTFPILASVCKRAGSKSRDCVARKFLNPMVAWKLAGLPKPANIFFTSFDGKRYIPNPFY